MNYFLSLLLVIAFSACGGGGGDNPIDPTGGVDITTGGGDTPAGDGDTTAGGEDTTTGGEETTPGDGDTTTGGEETTPGDGDTTTGGEDTTTGDGDTTAGGEETTAGGDQLGNYVFSFPPAVDETTAAVEATIEGVIRSAASGSALSNVEVFLNASRSTTTDSTGTYTFNDVANGTYTISYTRNGYLETAYTQVVDSVRGYNLETLQFIPSTYTGTSSFTGAILDAQTGDEITGATIKIRAGLNTKEGTVLKSITSTTAEYDLSLTKGYYTFEVSKADHIVEYYNMFVANDTQTKDLVLSKTLADDEIRVVLTWGETPSDLDSHLAKYEGSSLKYHVYYGNYTEGDASLDTDDTSSYGPETITFSNSTTGKYKYYVHNYSEKGKSVSSSLSSSGVKVTVYKGSQVTSYYPKAEAGTVWKVFEINNGYMQECTANCMKYESSASNTGTFGQMAPSRTNTAPRNLFLNLPAKK